MKAPATKVRKSAYRRRDYQAFLYQLPWILGVMILHIHPFI